jgi:hypothetical protein
MKASSIISKF